ncbi:hypothetical protein [Rhizobium sp. BK176]|uniref:hypothetical protein n=1 Tax=Rhizobium sp. BK176 TaxID=2587071 RepID=UPI0021692591|nr:hypothetical protein [Rhizobium sp. BK176]MCS4089737.1 hypothetical protein [Rhizobium sp. BK176]
MSIVASVYFAVPVSIDDWMKLAFARDIRYSPNTVGQSTFYGGGAEVSLAGNGTVGRRPDGSFDWMSAKPPLSFSKVSLTLMRGADVNTYVETVKAVYHELSGAHVTSDVELESFLVDLPIVSPIDKYDALLPTDVVEGWAFVDDGYEAKVQSGTARIARDGDLWSLHVEGILRAKVRELNDGFAFAGRCDWRYWHGERPEQPKQKQAALPGR